MKVYKYVSLANEESRRRFIESLHDNNIWLAKYPYLNDPMEGIYYTMDYGDSLRDLAHEKMELVLGCFGKSARNKILWAYYTAGYKGACIEVTVNPEYFNSMHQVDYKTYEDFQHPIDAITDNAEGILTRKLKFWKTENEYRFMERSDVQAKGIRKFIGEFTKIYMGINIDRATINYLSEHLNNNLPLIWSSVSPINPVVEHVSFDEMIDFHIDHLAYRNRHFEPEQVF